MTDRIQSSKASKYAHGHHESVLQSHTWRTAANSCGFLLPHIKPSMKILDIGCGPGTITADLAKLLPQGSIIGLDTKEEVLQKAREHAKSKGIQNIQFITGDVFKLDFVDGEFDIVFAHQVLQHVGDIAAALREMSRVTKAGGLVAARDMSHMLYYPEMEGLNRFVEIFNQISRGLGGVPRTGSMLKKFARQAGWPSNKIEVTAGTWCYANQEDLDWWCGMWADRIVNSEFKTNGINMGITTEEELVRISKVWTDFAEDEDAWFTVLHGELLYKK
jgi:ubiquinone/menaquinone biosynthesis C-methylase UbiE